MDGKEGCDHGWGWGGLGLDADGDEEGMERWLLYFEGKGRGYGEVDRAREIRHK